MPVNDFLAFAAAPGANVMTQAAYGALPAIATGFQAGTAQSSQVNKVLHQTSAVSSMIGRLIVELAAADARDDGDADELLADFKLAIAALASTTGIQVLTSVPSVNSGATIYVPPYGVTNSNGSIYQSERCGEVVLWPSFAAKPGSVELGGTEVAKVGPYAGLWAHA